MSKIAIRGTAAQRVALAYLGDAIRAYPARPHLQDPASARETPRLEFNPAAQVAIRVLEDRRGGEIVKCCGLAVKR